MSRRTRVKTWPRTSEDTRKLLRVYPNHEYAVKCPRCEGWKQIYPERHFHKDAPLSHQRAKYRGTIAYVMVHSELCDQCTNEEVRDNGSKGKGEYV